MKNPILLSAVRALFDTARVESTDHALHQTAAFAGFAAYALMVGTVVLGVCAATGVVRRTVRRETLYGAHMTMAVAALAFILAHAAGNVFRPAAHLSVWSAMVPFLHSSAMVATGVIAGELAVVTSVSVWFQRRLGYRRWQRVHALGYPTYGLAILHTVIAGSDVRKPLIVTFLLVTTVVVAVFAVLRALPASSSVRLRLAPLES
jgi:DMSO/TMAO reductase YedYZ heme-binding membrane subunit